MTEQISRYARALKFTLRRRRGRPPAEILGSRRRPFIMKRCPDVCFHRRQLSYSAGQTKQRAGGGQAGGRTFFQGGGTNKLKCPLITRSGKKQTGGGREKIFKSILSLCACKWRAGLDVVRPRGRDAQSHRSAKNLQVKKTQGCSQHGPARMDGEVADLGSDTKGGLELK